MVAEELTTNIGKKLQVFSEIVPLYFLPTLQFILFDSLFVSNFRIDIISLSFKVL